MIPSLLRSRPFGSVNRTRKRPWMRAPRRCTLRNSLRRRIRSPRERFRSTPPRRDDNGRPAPAGTLARNHRRRGLRFLPTRPVQRRLLGNGKALAPLGPAPSQDFSAGLRAHALAESVGPLATPVVRLIRALHALIILAARLGGHTRHQTIMVATMPDGCQRKPERLCLASRVVSGCRHRVSVVNFGSRPRGGTPHTEIFPQGVEETVDKRDAIAMRIGQ